MVMWQSLYRHVHMSKHAKYVTLCFKIYVRGMLRSVFDQREFFFFAVKAHSNFILWIIISYSQSLISVYILN